MRQGGTNHTECSWEITERSCRKELTANGEAWSRDHSDPLGKKQEGEGGRQLALDEEEGNGRVVKGGGLGLEYMLHAKKKKKMESSLALELSGDL